MSLTRADFLEEKDIRIKKESQRDAIKNKKKKFLRESKRSIVT